MKKRTILQIVLGAIMAMCMGAGVSCALNGPLEKPEKIVLDDLEILSLKKYRMLRGIALHLMIKFTKRKRTIWICLIK